MDAIGERRIASKLEIERQIGAGRQAKLEPLVGERLPWPLRESPVMLIFWFRGRADYVSVVALPKSNPQSAVDSRIAVVA